MTTDPPASTSNPFFTHPILNSPYEAHHCYREKPDDEDEDELKGEDKKEAEKNNDAARVWIAGLESVIFGVEVAGALARRGTQERDIRDLLQPLGRPPHRIVTIGPKGAAAAEARAIQARLRGADALYVWLASTRGLTLCTLDQEMAHRGAAFCTVIAP